ncbi:MAG: hypothetical protein NUW37_12455 [Planctomycetes bacterium]|nr:hypothetical protein [Planctomycetota bacterium]
MKKEYDLSGAEQGKFYFPPDRYKYPVYLDDDLNLFFSDAAKRRKKDVAELVNSVLRREMENFSELMPEAESDSGSKPAPKRKKA